MLIEITLLLPWLAVARGAGKGNFLKIVYP